MNEGPQQPQPCHEVKMVTYAEWQSVMSRMMKTLSEIRDAEPTRREKYAMAAMCAHIEKWRLYNLTPDEIAARSFEVADAMLHEGTR